jgi:hypothetical protein
MGTDSHEGWVIALGVTCTIAVTAALAWRVGAAGRQWQARAHASIDEAPPKHLALTPMRDRAGTPRV